MFENIFFQYHSVTKTKLPCSFVIWTTLKGHRRNIKIHILESAFENDGRQRTVWWTIQKQIFNSEKEQIITSVLLFQKAQGYVIILKI